MVCLISSIKTNQEAFLCPKGYKIFKGRVLNKTCIPSGSLAMIK
jgi:hypothetical protein